MAKHKYVAGSLRRRARTGRLVLNRRSRILNSTSRTSEKRDHDQKKAIRKLAVAPGSSAAVIMDDMHDFAGLDDGSFMIIKADNNRAARVKIASENHSSATQKSPQKLGENSPQKLDQKSAEQITFSQSLHDGRQDYREKNKTQTAPSSDANTLKPSDQSDHDRAPKSQPAATVVPLYTPNSKGAKKLTLKRQQSDRGASLNSDVIASHTDTHTDTNTNTHTDRHAATSEPFIEAAATPKETNYGETEMPQDRRLDANQNTIISDQHKPDIEIIESDSGNPASHALAIDDHSDDNIWQNWQIGSKVKTAMQSIVAEAIGQQVRQLTRSIIRDMINEGVLQLPENTHLDTSE